MLIDTNHYRVIEANSGHIDVNENDNNGYFKAFTTLPINMLIDNLIIIDNDFTKHLITLIKTALENMRNIGFNEASNLK